MILSRAIPSHLDIRWRRATSRARGRHARARGRHQGRHKVQLSLNLNLVAIPVAMGLSLKPRGRFRSFSAGKLLWGSRLYHTKFSAISPISEPWENFLISMATDWNFQISFSRGVFRAPSGPPCQVWCPSVRKRPRSSRTNKYRDVSQILVRYDF